ncbi:phosphate ABC transporter substrate-binding protein PstS [Jiangella anatolica]|uniref:Phosphate ABC transporter substrate-binding protein PstS n=1 Tax=Jiangella anatolica TaxID=2670374 RepID=A0A2W2BKE8_9ACTN|nr:phosphate ABC transporter substrate-binding protein PstS [Jiangella anatolica]PZF80768.1 phosphate ABC transporter substrate-binding protein PstS [Jiangella anatolica]
MTSRRRGRALVLRWAGGLLAVALIVQTVLTGAAPGARAEGSYVTISGSGSTWSQNAVEAWRRNVEQFGMTVNFAGNGSSRGRAEFREGTVDFGVSEIPYGIRDGNNEDPPPSRAYAYMPIVAGGTSIMYNLTIGAQRVTNLRLSGATIARIFTGQITHWNDPAIREDNPQLNLPAIQIVPVVRSDGSGTSAQFTAWMVSEQTDIWNAYCAAAGRNPCTQTSNYPVLPGSAFISQSGSNGVAGYVSQAAGAITYVEYSYAINQGFPVAKVLNDAGYYIEPTPEAVAVALLRAEINDNAASVNYLTQDLTNVYRNADPRSYPISSYSYMILPTELESGFTEQKGYTLGTFAQHFLCEGQQQAPALGYSPLPINLVLAGFDQVERIPGAQDVDINVAACNNPTFSSDGDSTTNVLAENAPYPPDCDRPGSVQCSTGTGGAPGDTPPSGGAEGGGTEGGGDGGTGGGGGGDGGGGAATGADGGGGTATGTDTGGAATGTDAGGTASGTDAGGTASGAADGTDTGAPVIDPETGEVIGGDGTDAGGGQNVSAVPVSLQASSGWRFQHTLMALAGLLLLGVVIGPPLITRLLGPRNATPGRTP